MSLHIISAVRYWCGEGQESTEWKAWLICQADLGFVSQFSILLANLLEPCSIKIKALVQIKCAVDEAIIIYQFSIPPRPSISQLQLSIQV